MSLSDSWNRAIRIPQKPFTGRMRLLARWSKLTLRSLKEGYFDFAGNAIRAQWQLMWLTLRDIISEGKKVECNICGWTGYDFYPNVVWGFNDRSVLCAMSGL